MKRLIPKYGLYLILIAILPWAPNALAQNKTASPLEAAGPADSDVVTLKTAWSVDRATREIRSRLPLWSILKTDIHINADASQVKPFEDFKPYPTKVQVVAATGGVTIETARFPQAKPIKVSYSSGALMSFEGRAIIYLPMKLDEQIRPGSIGLEIRVEYQACSDRYCLFPQKALLKETLAVVESGTATSKINAQLFANLFAGEMAAPAGVVNFDLFGWQFSINTSSGFGWIVLLLTAALGGLLLNLTPCVLPLIPIKIISLSHVAQDRKKCFFLWLAMSMGVLVFWTGLGILIALISDFSATNQLFQYPVFTILVGAIIGIMALGMFGFFSVRLPRFIYMINPQQDSPQGSFGLGILAAVLSTPCTAPFMGAAACMGSNANAADNPGHLCRHRWGYGPAVSDSLGFSQSGRSDA